MALFSKIKKLKSVLDVVEIAKKGGQSTDIAAPLSEEDVRVKLKDVRGKVFGTVVKCLTGYGALMTAGLVLGGLGAGLGAAAIGASGLVLTGLTALGAVAGTAGGFFAGHVLAVNFVRGLLLETGISAGAMGLRGLLTLVRPGKTKTPAPAAALAQGGGNALPSRGAAGVDFQSAGKQSTNPVAATALRPAQKQKI